MTRVMSSNPIPLIFNTPLYDPKCVLQTLFFLPWFLGDAYYMLIWTGDGIIHHGCCHWVYHTIATKRQHRKVRPSEIVMIYVSIYLGVAFYPIASCWGGLHRTLLHWGPSQPQKESHGAACPGQQEFRRINGYVYSIYTIFDIKIIIYI